MGVLDDIIGEVLDTCAVTWCKGSLQGEILVKELHLATFKGCLVIRAAGALLLLLFTTLEKGQEVLDRTDLDTWFDKVLAWSSDVAFDSRSSWVSLVGLMVQFWFTDTSTNIARLWGSFVHLDEHTADPRSFERAQILIETKDLERIEEIIEIDYNGVLFSVRAQEVEVVHSHDIIC
ncbi:hypothetical protein V6N13_113981 [Hibiscus sabdariffa]